MVVMCIILARSGQCIKFVTNVMPTRVLGLPQGTENDEKKRKWWKPRQEIQTELSWGPCGRMESRDKREGPRSLPTVEEGQGWASSCLGGEGECARQQAAGLALGVCPALWWCRVPDARTAAAAELLQSCPTLCHPTDCSPPGSPVPGILQTRALEWVAISFSNAGKWKVKMKALSRVRLLETPWTAAYQAPPSMGLDSFCSGHLVFAPWSSEVAIGFFSLFVSCCLYFALTAKVNSVQFSHSVMSDSLQPHELQHARPPCPSPTPRVHPNSCPSSRWCHPAISSSVVPFSSCLQSLPASESFPMSQLFAWGGQNIGVSASASVLAMNTQD